MTRGAAATMLSLIAALALRAETVRESRSERYDPLAAFARESQAWGGGVPSIIDEAFRRCFKTYVVADRILTLRIPFAQNNERSELAFDELAVVGGGKADPASIWAEVDGLLASADFAEYVSTLSDGRDKVIVFDLERRSWSSNRDWFYIARMKSGLYPGMPHKPIVINKGRGVSTSDIYNYLYCVGRVGMDCAGFVWSALKSIARKGAIDLDRAVAKSVGSPGGSKTPLFIGARYFDPRNRDLESVDDRIENLRPGDVIVFRAEDGEVVHSAIIQSVDLKAGRIRYLQSTDESPQDERGVHESIIDFDPARFDASLKDASVVWRQARRPAFEGEADGPYKDDGERYRAHPDEIGGSAIVRLKALKRLTDLLDGRDGP